MIYDFLVPINLDNLEQVIKYMKLLFQLGKQFSVLHYPINVSSMTKLSFKKVVCGESHVLAISSNLNYKNRNKKQNNTCMDEEMP